jgi:hypothetical protein
MIRTIVYQQHCLLVNKFLIWPKFVEIAKEDTENIVLEKIGIDVYLGPWFESKIDTEAKAVFFQMIVKGFKILRCNSIIIYEVRHHPSIDIHAVIECTSDFCWPYDVQGVH